MALKRISVDLLNGFIAIALTVDGKKVFRIITKIFVAHDLLL
jgi:hypothetical protein